MILQVHDELVFRGRARGLERLSVGYVSGCRTRANSRFR
jgi:hypothetical protein